MQQCSVQFILCITKGGCGLRSCQKKLKSWDQTRLPVANCIYHVYMHLFESCASFFLNKVQISFFLLQQIIDYFCFFMGKRGYLGLFFYKWYICMGINNCERPARAIVNHHTNLTRELIINACFFVTAVSNVRNTNQDIR